MPDTLNPQALPTEFNPYVDEKTGVNKAAIIKAHLSKDAVYVTTKKKTKGGPNKVWHSGKN